VLPAKVAILGPGLIGGSLALALRDSDPSRPVSLWARRDATVQEVQRAGFRDAGTDLAAAVRDASVVVFCVPVEKIADLARDVVLHCPNSACITDVGSTKQRVVDWMDPLFPGRFVGSHPMAGSEKSGFAAASTTLFRGAPCILTPTSRALTEAIEGIRRLWLEVGARVELMTAAAHDRLVARISHFPHLAASALVQLLGENGSDSQHFAGTGYRDTTRVAAGSAELWAGILSENRAEIVSALDEFVEILQNSRALLSENRLSELHDFLFRAKTTRDQFPVHPVARDV